MVRIQGKSDEHGDVDRDLDVDNLPRLCSRAHV